MLEGKLPCFKWIAKICKKVEKGLKIKAATKCIFKSLKISLVALLMFHQNRKCLANCNIFSSDYKFYRKINLPFLHIVKRPSNLLNSFKIDL